MARIVAKQWTPCPKGELDRLESRLRVGRLWQTVGTWAAVAFVGFAIAFASWKVAETIWPSSAAQQCPPQDCRE